MSPYLQVHIPDLLRHVHWLNQWDADSFVPFYIAGVRVGYLNESMRNALQQWPQHFDITAHCVELTGGSSVSERSQTLQDVAAKLVEQGVIAHYLDEPYPVTSTDRDTDYAALDRGASAYFGIRAYGQHVNGFVRDEHGLRMWIGRRSADRIRFPDKLDNIVAGGLPRNQTLASNLIKECHEEAGLNEDLVRTARPVGAVSYCRETDIGLKPDTLYCYDLELPSHVIPVNTDGEVAAFMLLDMQEVADLIQDTDEFKNNCALVIIDFMIRHGLIDPAAPGYLDLVRGLRNGVHSAG